MQDEVIILEFYDGFAVARIDAYGIHDHTSLYPNKPVKAIREAMDMWPALIYAPLPIKQMNRWAPGEYHRR